MFTNQEFRRDRPIVRCLRVHSGIPARITGLSKVEAERILDWLEVSGFPPFRVSLDEEGFALECLTELPSSLPF
jgi:hypothetical protein